MSVWIAVQAWGEYFYIDLIKMFGFNAVHRVVKRTRTRPGKAGAATIATVLESARVANVVYFKPIHCLQRSAVVTRLLRRRGIEADMIIGCHPAPLKAHAWVEVEGNVVSDDVEGLEFYRVLDRW